MDKISFDFKGRTAIVTGGAQGFGLDITKRLIRSGASVIIWDNDQKMVEKAIEDIKLPAGTTIGAIVRNDDVLIAHDDTVIQSGDHVIMFLIDKSTNLQKHKE